MKITRTTVIRVHAAREEGDPEWPEVTSPFDSPGFFIRPDTVTAEYDAHPGEPGGLLGFMQIEIEGERFRRLKAGPKSTGHGRATFTRDELAYQERAGRVPKELHGLIRQLRQED